MVRIVIVAALLAGTASAPASAQRTIIGHGLSSCGTWTQERREARGAIPTRAWILGYLSGVNALDGDADFLAPVAVDSPAIFGWIDNYCRSKPLDNVQDAVNGLMIELRSRARRAR
jgi:hypothetical protein